MALIRLQDKVPNEYVDKSRDFQLLLRLYDVILNGLKYDIDGVERLISTHDCKSNTLQLLQTKLGFFTPKNYTDVYMRKVLECFPFLVKGKGTRTAIEQTVYMYLKIMGLQTEIQVDIINDKPTSAQLRQFGSKVTDHTVVIGIESLERDVTLLKDVLRYIIPFGYNLFFYFFVGSNQEDIFVESDKAKMVLISNDINSAMMGSVPVTDTTYTRPVTDVWGRIERNREERPYTYYWNDMDASVQEVDELPSIDDGQEGVIYKLTDKKLFFKWRPEIVVEGKVIQDAEFYTYDVYQYNTEPTNSLISTINMTEVGLSESMAIDTSTTPWTIDKLNILNEEKDIEDIVEG